MPNNAYLAMGLGEALGLAFAILIFVAVMGGFVYLSKRMSGGKVFSGRRIKVIDRMMLSRDSYVMLVQIGMRLLAIGVGKGAPTILCELSPSDFPEYAKKTDESPKDTGFWNLFKRNMKASLTKGGAAPTEDNASFAAVLQQMAEKDPVPGAENARDAGYPHLWEEERRPAPPRFRRPNYQASIENMTRLSEPDTLDRRSRFYGDTSVRPGPRPAAGPPPQAAYTAPPPPAAPALPSNPYDDGTGEEDRSERIDQLLDLIAQRQSRMDDRNDTGDMG